jgi:glycine/D-amino acid oxidase-like deaminating enzyme
LAADQQTDVLIVGGGVCGTALLFELARYTDLGTSPWWSATASWPR